MLLNNGFKFLSKNFLYDVSEVMSLKIIYNKKIFRLLTILLFYFSSYEIPLLNKLLLGNCHIKEGKPQLPLTLYEGLMHRGIIKEEMLCGVYASLQNYVSCQFSKIIIII